MISNDFKDNSMDLYVKEWQKNASQGTDASKQKNNDLLISLISNKSFSNRDLYHFMKKVDIKVAGGWFKKDESSIFSTFFPSKAEQRAKVFEDSRGMNVNEFFTQQEKQDNIEVSMASKTDLESVAPQANISVPQKEPKKEISHTQSIIPIENNLYKHTDFTPNLSITSLPGTEEKLIELFQMLVDTTKKYGETVKFHLAVDEKGKTQLLLRATNFEMAALSKLNPNLTLYANPQDPTRSIFFSSEIYVNGLKSTRLDEKPKTKGRRTIQNIAKTEEVDDLRKRYHNLSHERYLLPNELPKFEKYTGDSKQNAEILTGLLSNAKGLSVGEVTHGDAAPKKILIEQMQHLYDLGVRTFFLEHCCIDTIQDQLDIFYHTKKPTPFLEEFLKNGFGFCVREKHHNYYDVVKAAVDVGISPVALETSKSQNLGFSKYGFDLETRMLDLNVEGKEIIDKRAGTDKYMLLVGGAHSSKTANIAGFSELCSIPVLTIGDKEQATKASYLTNVVNVENLLQLGRKLGGKQGEEHFSHAVLLV